MFCSHSPSASRKERYCFMRISTRFLTLFLTFCLVAAACPTIALSVSDGSTSDETTATASTEPTTDAEITAALETYDASIDDPEYQEAYDAYQSYQNRDEDASLSLYSGSNPYTGKSYSHKHDKTSYIYDGIDVSKWQGTINWSKVKADGIDFAFIRCGNTSLSSFAINADSKFATNVKNAYAAGIKVGVYYYSGATSATEAKKEANYVLSQIKSYKSKIALPVVMDYETNGSDRIYKCYKNTSKSTRTNFVKTFCSVLENAGFDGGVYASKAWLTDFFSMSSLTAYSSWVAQWASSTSYAYDYDFWQYSDSGDINGISGYVDCNFWYSNEKLSTASVSNSNSSSSSSSATLLAPYITSCKTYYRTGCGTNYTAKGSISGNKPVNVVYGWYKTVNGKKWYKVKIGSRYYYMYGPNLSHEVLVKYAATSKLGYRYGAGSRYNSKGTYAKGAAVNVVKGWSKNADGHTWYKVKVGSSYYYTKAKYLSRRESLILFSVNSTVNVRSGPGTNYTRKASLYKGTSVAVVSGATKTVSGKKWYRVKIGSSYYYIMASYLTRM